MSEVILIICGAISTIGAAILATRKLYFWLRPIKLEPSCTIYFENSGKDSINVVITNKTSETQYLVACEARGTYSLKHILKRHLSRPFIRPSLYQNIWYGGSVYSLLKGDPVKLEPMQQISLKHELYEHPLNAMHTPYFVIKAHLSSGKIISSTKLHAPFRWKMLGSNPLKQPETLTKSDKAHSKT